MNPLSVCFLMEGRRKHIGLPDELQPLRYHLERNSQLQHMFLWDVHFNFGILQRSATTKLPRPNLQVDPRPICTHDDDDGDDDDLWLTFRVTYHDDGRTVTITKQAIDPVVYLVYKFRIYDPATETVPSFESTTYNYLGIEGEQAPWDTVVTNIDKSVKIIHKYAFNHCTKMKFCFIHDDVEVIDKHAFNHCTTLKIIKLPKKLQRIGERAFRNCAALDAIFIPPSIEHIDDHAFQGCKNMRILSLPPTIPGKKLGNQILEGCDTFFRITGIAGYAQHDVNIQWNENNEIEVEVTRTEVDEEVYETVRWIVGEAVNVVNAALMTHQVQNEHIIEERSRNVDLLVNLYVGRAEQLQIYQSISGLYNTTPSLHKACLDVDVSPQSIHDGMPDHTPIAISSLTQMKDHDGMTPLHILTMNPHATPESILVCLNLNINAALARDNSDMMPMDYLWRYENIDSLIIVIQALCLYREAHSDSFYHHHSKRQRVK